MSRRGRADEFAAVVEGTRTPADVSDDAREFYAIVSRLRDVEAPAMRPEFAADLRERLMTAAPTALAELPPMRAGKSSAKETRLVDDSWSTTRRLRIATATLVVCATAGGVAAASQSALPGDPLYQVKRGLEWMQVATAGSDQNRGDVLLDQASERLSEAEQLAASRPDDPRTSSLISDTLDDFEQQATDGSDALVDDYRSSGDPASIAEVREFADESVSRLGDLGQIVPPDLQRDLVDAAGVLTEIDGQARDTCELCSTLTPLQLSPSLSDLAQTTQSVVDAVPGDLGSAGGGDATQQPPIKHPTLPVLPGNPGDNGSGHQGGRQGQGDSQQTGGGRSHQPRLPLPTGGGSTTSPTLPLPSIPGLPKPSIPVPSVPVPSVPLPSLPVPALPTLPLPTILPVP
ncbi:MAG TPA: DUF5667 domain-containing protein [Nocardioidaceae bacterium]|nr:DUF5667 domain-containing protein [Nocardioidaceae bacterium]